MFVFFSGCSKLSKHEANAHSVPMVSKDICSQFCKYWTSRQDNIVLSLEIWKGTGLKKLFANFNSRMLFCNPFWGHQRSNFVIRFNNEFTIHHRNAMMCFMALNKTGIYQIVKLIQISWRIHTKKSQHHNTHDVSCRLKYEHRCLNIGKIQTGQ